MQDRVADDRAQRRVQTHRRLDPEEHHRAEQRGRDERLAAREVEHEEPEGDHDGADEAGDDAFPDYRALTRVHGVYPRRHLTPFSAAAGKP